MNDKKKKEYKKPEAEILEFAADDIIVTSLTEAEENEQPGWTGEGWWN